MLAIAVVAHANVSGIMFKMCSNLDMIISDILGQILWDKFSPLETSSSIQSLAKSRAHLRLVKANFQISDEGLDHKLLRRKPNLVLKFVGFLQLYCQR
jgi:hypothetical protein